jgi:hypothetical protein
MLPELDVVPLAAWQESGGLFHDLPTGEVRRMLGFGNWQLAQRQRRTSKT